MGNGDAGGACGGWVVAGMTGGEPGGRSLLSARGLDPLGPLLAGWRSPEGLISTLYNTSPDLRFGE